MDAKVRFLQNAANIYSESSPQLASYFGSRLSGALKMVGVQRNMLCPCCCSPFSPWNTSTRTLTHSHLKRERRKKIVKGHNLPSFTSEHCRSYVAVQCKACHRNTVIGGHRSNSTHHSHTAPSTPHSTPSSATPSSARSAKSQGTPCQRSAGKKRSGCGLRAALQQSQKFKRTSVSTPPQLSDFLSSLHGAS